MKRVFFSILLVSMFISIASAECMEECTVLDFVMINEMVQEVEYRVSGWPVIDWPNRGELPIAATRHCYVDSREATFPPCLIIRKGPVTVSFAGVSATVNEVSIWRVTRQKDYFITFTYTDGEGPSVAEIQAAILHPAATPFCDFDQHKDRRIDRLDLEVLAKKLLPPSEHQDDWEWLLPTGKAAPSPIVPKMPERPYFLLSQQEKTGKLAATWGGIKR